MPFTPLHLGPGAALKAALGRRFSFSVFALSQVLIDLEPGARMLLDAEPLHPHLHTYAGATAVALASAVLGKPVCEWALRTWNRQLSASQARWLGVETSIRRVALWTGALLGAYSHVLIDSIMHADIRPLRPFAQGNRLLGYVSIEELHLWCIALGIAGIAVLMLSRLLKSHPPRGVDR
jgi:hypothetical protein